MQLEVVEEELDCQRGDLLGLHRNCHISLVLQMPGSKTAEAGQRLILEELYKKRNLGRLVITVYLVEASDNQDLFALYGNCDIAHVAGQLPVYLEHVPVLLEAVD